MARFCPLQPLQPFFHQKTVFAFAVPLQPFRSLFARYPLPFAVPLQPNACNVHSMRFLSRFRRLFVSCVHLHRLPYFVRLYSPILPYFAVLCGVWVGLPPKPKRREAQLRSRRILYFLNPKKFFLKNLLPLTPCLLKIFFLENSLSPPTSCSLSCQNSPFS